MNRYLFYGSILPERSNIQIPKATWHIEHKTAVDIEINLECHCSKIIAECLPKVKIDTRVLKHYVEAAVRTMADCIGYSIVCGYDVIIDSVYDIEKKTTTLFSPHENIFDSPKINQNTAEGIPHPDFKLSLSHLAQLCTRYVELQVALSD